MKMTKVSTFTERFTELCEESDLNDAENAAALSVSRQSVCMWTSGERSPRQPMVINIAGYFKVNITWLLGYDTPKRGMIPKNVIKYPSNRIPLLGEIAAGEPIYNEFTDEYVEANINADCALIVRGNSMYPLYRDGDIVYIRECPDIAYNGQIAAVIVDDEATLKRVYKGPQIRLKSENTDYPDMVVDPAVKSVRILGKVVGFTRIFREEEP